MHSRMVVASIVAFGAACTDPGSPPPENPPGAETNPDLPPYGDSQLSAWLAAGYYNSWSCEPAPHPARPPGAHGANRICSNSLLAASANGPYPIGAASVKELYRDGSLVGHAVGRKLATASEGASWYWYEAVRSDVVADGVDASLCSDCHDGAPRDFVFTHVD